MTDEAILETLCNRCLNHFKGAPLPDQIRHICDELTWGMLSDEELNRVTDEIRRRHSADLSYLAYKNETGDESRNWLRF